MLFKMVIDVGNCQLVYFLQIFTNLGIDMFY